MRAKDEDWTVTPVLFSLLCSIITEKIEEIYKAFIKESGIQFSELEGQVLQFHLGNLEYACGSTLHQVRGPWERGLEMLAWLCAVYVHIPNSGWLG